MVVVEVDVWMKVILRWEKEERAGGETVLLFCLKSRLWFFRLRSGGRDILDNLDRSPYGSNSTKERKRNLDKVQI